MPVVIVDYGMGNLFSVKQACERAGMAAIISASTTDLLTAPAVVLPGVGAFGVAMENLRRLDLVFPLREFAASGRPLVGICLGMQLVMTESVEFGRHEGLGLIEGDVVRLEIPEAASRRLKVPHVGWNRIRAERSWQGSLLDGVADREFMYFVHSFYCRPADPRVVLATTTYGRTQMCSTLAHGNVLGFQFHPERSGPAGLQIYRNLATVLGMPQGAASTAERSTS